MRSLVNAPTLEDAKEAEGRNGGPGGIPGMPPKPEPGLLPPVIRPGIKDGPCPPCDPPDRAEGIGEPLVIGCMPGFIFPLLLLEPGGPGPATGNPGKPGGAIPEPAGGGGIEGGGAGGAFFIAGT